MFESGILGNEAFFPCLIPQGPNLPYTGTPMPNPPQYSTVAGQDVRLRHHRIGAGSRARAVVADLI